MRITRTDKAHKVESAGLNLEVTGDVHVERVDQGRWQITTSDDDARVILRMDGMGDINVSSYEDWGAAERSKQEREARGFTVGAASPPHRYEPTHTERAPIHANIPAGRWLLLVMPAQQFGHPVVAFPEGAICLSVDWTKPGEWGPSSRAAFLVPAPPEAKP